MTFVVTAVVAGGAGYLAAGAATTAALAGGATAAAASSAALTAGLSTGALAGATTLSAMSYYNQGKAMEIQYKQQAEQEKLAAQSQELERRQRLNKVLASNILGMATSGLAGEGSPLSLSLESAKTASVSEGIESVNQRLREAQLRRQGANAAATGRLQAASTLLQGASQAAQLYPGK